MSLLIQDIVNIVNEYGDDPNIIVAFANFDKSIDKKKMYPKLINKIFDNDENASVEEAFLLIPDNSEDLDKAFIRAYILNEIDSDDIKNINNYKIINQIAERKDGLVLDYVLRYTVPKLWRTFFNRLVRNYITIGGDGLPNYPGVNQRISLFRSFPTIILNLGTDYAYDIYNTMNENFKKQTDDYMKIWKFEHRFKY